MLTIISDALRTAVRGSKPRHQRMSHEEWQDRFVSPRMRRETQGTYRFDPNRDLW